MASINDWEDVPLDNVTDWEDVTDTAVAETPDVSKLESFGRGGAQGLSFGFADEITGALESMISDKSYTEARDESRANYMKAEEANPKTFVAGNVAGAVAPVVAATLASGGTAAPAALGASVKALAPTTIKGMAAMGAVDALGRSEADLTKGEVVDAAKDMGRGAVVGTVAGAAGKGISAVGENLLPALKKLATEGGESALGITTQAIKRMPGEMGGVSKAEEVAEFALKGNKALDGKSIVDAGSNTKAMWEKATKVRDAAGEDIGSILTKMDEVGPVPSLILNEMDGVLAAAKTKISDVAPELGATVTGQYQKAINDFQALATNPNVPLTFAKLGEFKKAIGDIAFKHGSPLESKAALQEVYSVVNDGLERAVDTVSGAIKNAEYPAAYKAAKKAYDMSLRAIDGLEGKAAKEAGGKWVGFGDVIVGGIGSSIGGVPGAIAAVGIKRAAEARGAQTIGKTSFTMAEKLERALTANPQILGKFLPMLQQAAQRGTLAATNYVLQQRDPEYAETLKKLDETDGNSNE